MADNPASNFTTLDEAGDSTGQYSSPPAETVSMKKWSSRDAGELANGGFIDDESAPYDQPDNYLDVYTSENAGG